MSLSDNSCQKEKSPFSHKWNTKHLDFYTISFLDHPAHLRFMHVQVLFAMCSSSLLSWLHWRWQIFVSLAITLPVLKLSRFSDPGVDVVVEEAQGDERENADEGALVVAAKNHIRGIFVQLRRPVEDANAASWLMGVARQVVGADILYCVGTNAIDTSCRNRVVGVVWIDQDKLEELGKIHLKVEPTVRRVKLR